MAGIGAWLQTKAAAALGMLPPNPRAGAPQWTDWTQPDAPRTDARSLIRSGYEGNSAVFACVQALQRAFPEPTLRWYRGTGKQRQELPATHPLVALTARPNALMGADELWAFLVAYAAIGGDAHLYKLRAKGGAVGELWPYHAAELYAVPGVQRWIAHYAYVLASGDTLAIDPADVVHWKWAINPRVPYRALAPLAPVMREVLTDSELTRFLQAMLINDAVPRGALVLPAGAAQLSDAQFKRTKDDWVLKHGGGYRGGVALLEGGLQYQRIALNMAELDLTAQRAVPERRIAGALGVPVQVAGLGNDPTYSNYEQAELAFVRRTLVPLWKSLASELTADLGRDFGPDFYAEFDLGEVVALQENQAEKRKFVVQAYQGGIMTLNEARADLGKDPVATGDGFYAPPVGGMAPDLVPTPAPPKAAPGPAAAKALAPAARRVETRIAAVTERLLTEQYHAVAAHVEAADA